MKKKIVAFLLAAVLCLSIAPMTFAAQSIGNFKKVADYVTGQFVDVPESQWYAQSVKTAYELGLVKGSDATHFNPTGNISIAETITLAARLHSIYTDDGTEFVQGSVWYQVYVDYAVGNGIITASQFSDYNAKATRAQFAVILAASLPESELAAINSIRKLPDVTQTADYIAAVLKLYNAGILTGSDSYGTFNPNSNIQRSEVAAIVTRMADPTMRKTFTPEKKPITALTSDLLQGAWIYTYNNSLGGISKKEIYIQGDNLTITNYEFWPNGGDVFLKGVKNAEVYTVYTGKLKIFEPFDKYYGHCIGSVDFADGDYTCLNSMKGFEPQPFTSREWDSMYGYSYAITEIHPDEGYFLMDGDRYEYSAVSQVYTAAMEMKNGGNISDKYPMYDSVVASNVPDYGAIFEKEPTHCSSNNGTFPDATDELADYFDMPSDLVKWMKSMDEKYRSDSFFYSERLLYSNYFDYLDILEECGFHQTKNLGLEATYEDNMGCTVMVSQESSLINRSYVTVTVTIMRKN